MLRKYWIELRSSLWFVPAALVVAGVAMALVLVQLDIAFAEPLHAQSWRPWLNAGAEGARGMLTAIASSMITVAGVAFSVTIVTLSLASTQYTPRILRNFMRDRANQYVLGAFVGIYAYCIVVLRTIRGQDGTPGTFVPLLAVFFAVLMALLSIGMLIFFIHHVAASIQASAILGSISRETLAAIDDLFPEELGNAAEEVSAVAPLVGKTWHTVPAGASGYLQHLHSEGLMEFARKHGLILRLDLVPGDFVAEGGPLLFADRAVKDDDAAPLRTLFVVGDFRTVGQDAAFGVRQIVDIAMKALSPGVNDTSTAVSCLDYLSVILASLSRRRYVTPFRAEDGKLCVIAPVPSFADFVGKAFNEIRLCSAGNVTILLEILHAIRRVAVVTRHAAPRAPLIEHARLACELADQSVPAPSDRARINAEIAAVREALEADSKLPSLPPEQSEAKST